MPNEARLVERWLYATLAADSAVGALVSTRIYPGEAPATIDADLARIVYSQMSAEDTVWIGSVRAKVDFIYWIHGSAKTGSFGGVLGDIAAAIDGALHDKSATVTGGLILSCSRAYPMQSIDPPEYGVRYRHAGGVYKIRAQAT